ncbi:TIGR00255 family protein [Malonomonas rubra DSM 5091]|uniref:TIGR00255 family protein n=1 Tax=Malonomonas rubra DSM 5091 TaxID=1122189 RepID=A0A1M6DQR8_MALRU|nr:YicC/YloC family endoribonuclease [Malonomonas rubra]SHI75551.1 TIGR00255 family protein [Malonomonas rubra DSM 5091]
MIKSMTGYGRGQAHVDGLSFSVEIKAVNHRYGDINVKAPRVLMPLESQIKKQVSAVLKRGKVDVFITQDASGAGSALPVINEPLAEEYMKIFKGLTMRYDLSGGISLGLLLAQKDVLSVEDAGHDEQVLSSCLKEAIDAALQALLVMRQKEGEATAVDIKQRLELLESLLEKIVVRAPQVPVEWQQKLKDRLERLGDDAGDPQRVAQEIAIFADRCDISEEVTRFRSHLEQFNELLQNGEPVGRQMDFLVQELNREANTMGSKSNDAELTRHVVLLKSELEKIREQVQNIE